MNYKNLIGISNPNNKQFKINTYLININLTNSFITKNEFNKIKYFLKFNIDNKESIYQTNKYNYDKANKYLFKLNKHYENKTK